MPHLLRSILRRLPFVWIVLGVLGQQTLPAQPARPRTASTPALRTLESKTVETRQAYLSQLGELATGYEQSGNGAQAEETLRQILKVTPDDEQIKARLKQLQDKVFQENQRVIEVEATKGWISTGLKVTKGEPIRLMSEGTYKFIVNTDLGPEGFATQDVMRDMGAGVNCGALMGTVLAESNRPGRPPQPTAPFTIGKEGEIRPDADGILFVRLNVPPGSKCIGKVRLMIMGNIAGLGG